LTSVSPISPRSASMLLGSSFISLGIGIQAVNFCRK
jgi:hypothetical protein